MKNSHRLRLDKVGETLKVQIPSVRDIIKLKFGKIMKFHNPKLTTLFIPNFINSRLQKSWKNFQRINFKILR